MGKLHAAIFKRLEGEKQLANALADGDDLSVTRKKTGLVLFLSILGTCAIVWFIFDRISFSAHFGKPNAQATEKTAKEENNPHLNRFLLVGINAFDSVTHQVSRLLKDLENSMAKSNQGKNPWLDRSRSVVNYLRKHTERLSGWLERKSGRKYTEAGPFQLPQFMTKVAISKEDYSSRSSNDHKDFRVQWEGDARPAANSPRDYRSSFPASLPPNYAQTPLQANPTVPFRQANFQPMDNEVAKERFGIAMQNAPAREFSDLDYRSP